MKTCSKRKPVAFSSLDTDLKMQLQHEQLLQFSSSEKQTVEEEIGNDGQTTYSGVAGCRVQSFSTLQDLS